MDRRVAMGLALTSAALAVAVVAVDLQFNVTVSLETLRDGAWVVVASQESDGFASPRLDPGSTGCAGPEMRVVVANGLPWGASPSVRVTVYDYATGTSEVLVSQDIEAARGATVVIPFTVPDWALNATTMPDKPGGPANVEAIVGDAYLSTCVEAP